jgi:hypothetical protein
VSLTGRHIAPKLRVTTLVVRVIRLTTQENLTSDTRYV